LFVLVAAVGCAAPRGLPATGVEPTLSYLRGIPREKLEGVAVDLSTPQAISIDAMIARLAGARIVIVGETHDNINHHLLQRDVLAGVHKGGRNVAVGMEMFQGHQAEHLDAYTVKHETDERTFIRNADYYGIWGFDYCLYRPILDFARTNRLRVVPLNVKRAIVQKVARGGIKSLGEEDRAQIPEVDTSNAAHREYVLERFEGHGGRMPTSPDFFYEAQCLWDEHMAESAAKFLRANPDYSVVICAGNGHVEYKFGIPDRVGKRSGLPVKTVVPIHVEKDEPLDFKKVLTSGIADFVVFTGPPAQKAALGIVLTQQKPGETPAENGRGIPIESVTEGSGAADAGLLAGDVILQIGEIEIASKNDLRFAMERHNIGETVKLLILRNGKELDIPVVLKAAPSE
jgi:uncharacterized iron-regulated protein